MAHGYIIAVKATVPYSKKRKKKRTRTISMPRALHDGPHHQIRIHSFCIPQLSSGIEATIFFFLVTFDSETLFGHWTCLGLTIANSTPPK